MKILQINKFYYRRRGAETYFFDVINLLQANGHDVAVFAMQHPENLPSTYAKYFVSEVDYSRHSLGANLKAAGRMFWSTEAQRRLEALLQEFKPDVAHVHNIYHQISPSILRTLKRHHIPIVQTLHDYKLLCPNYELYTRGEVCERCKGHNYRNAVRYNCLKNSRALSLLAAAEMTWHKHLQVYEQCIDCFISPSQFLRTKVQQWGEAVKRIEVLPNFIAPTDISHLASALQPADNYLFYSGAISEIKGVKLLLDNFKNNHYDCALLLAGNGPKFEEYKATYESNNIHFLGQLPRAELFSYIGGALAVIVPSRYYENFPYSVVEAMAHGKPVIGSNRGGIPELVQPGKTGYVFDPNQPDSLHLAIAQLLSATPAERAALGASARSHVEHLCSSQTHYEKLLAIYQSVIA